MDQTNVTLCANFIMNSFSIILITFPKRPSLNTVNEFDKNARVTNDFKPFVSTGELCEEY